jgi:hypothetical protein
MAYTAEKPNPPPPREVLEKTIVGWGADLDPRNRPSYPKEKLDLAISGAHWHFPERQVPHFAREKSTEHKYLTPVFGTTCPPKGLSGVIRRFAYRRYSEGRAAHWLLLMFADRIDVLESRITALLRLRPDNPIAEMGLKSEITGHGIRSRFGQRRTDLGLGPSAHRRPVARCSDGRVGARPRRDRGRPRATGVQAEEEGLPLPVGVSVAGAAAPIQRSGGALAPEDAREHDDGHTNAGEHPVAQA